MIFDQVNSWCGNRVALLGVTDCSFGGGLWTIGVDSSSLEGFSGNE